VTQVTGGGILEYRAAPRPSAPSADRGRVRPRDGRSATTTPSDATVPET
jgi:hypothetical protein